ncbi:hypothetical protein EDC94DRAFT_583711 [Helicostylum pulchrum]|nr:hypothetical protein EDC94DRAFT_583711 [Helicostylum pulchrum]
MITITLIAKPIVTVFGTHVTRIEISLNFEPTTFEFAKGIPKHHRGSHQSNSPTSNDGISIFFPSQKLSLLSSEFQDDPTIQKLHSTAKEQTSTRIPAEKSVTEALLEVCDQTNKQFKKISNTLEPMPDTLLKKRLRAYTSDGLLYTETCKRMYIGESDSLVEPMPPPPELSELAKSLVNQFF